MSNQILKPGIGLDNFLELKQIKDSNDILLSKSLHAIQEARAEKKSIINKLEKIRLIPIRSKYQAGIINQAELETTWKQWKDQKEFMLLQNEDNSRTIAIKMAKRGNDVYQYRVKERFKELDYLADKMDYDYFEHSDKVKKTNALYVTLT